MSAERLEVAIELGGLARGALAGRLDLDEAHVELAVAAARWSERERESECDESGSTSAHLMGKKRRASERTPETVW